MRIAKRAGIRRLVSVALGALVVGVTVAVASSALAAPLRASSATLQAVSAEDAPKSIGVIVRFKQPSSAPLAAKLLSAITSSTAAPSNAKRGLYSFTAPYTQTDELFSVQLMLAASGVAYAEPNYVRHIDTYVAPTDPDYNSTETWYSGSDYYLSAKHWWQTAMNAAGAWSIGEGNTYPVHGTSSSIKVAVIDTGIYLNHPEFAGGTVTAGVDECASYNPLTDALTTDLDITPDATTEVYYQSHGTAVAAAVGAEVNGSGTVGSGWNPQIVGYKVAGPLTAPWDGSAAGDLVIVDSAAANGIYDAISAGCKVINLSLGGTGYSQTYEDAITYAHSQGVVVCASSGNDAGSVPNYPAACTYATGVGAVRRSGGSGTPPVNGTITWADFSNHAPGVVDLTAPGVMIWSAIKPGYDDGVDSPGYTFWDGTSFSSPAVAGAIAYIWRAMPDLTNDQIVAYMENSATDLGSTGRDNYYGYGLVNMQAAYNKLVTDYPTLAKPAISTSSTVRSGASVSWGASSGYNVNYQVSVDGTLRSAQTSTSYTLPTLSDGQHVIAVLPTSTRNWNTSSLATKTLTLDSTLPTVSAFAFDGSAVTWSVSDNSTYTVSAYFDSGTAAAVASNTLSAVGLPSGEHTIHVNATDAAGNSSGWVSWVFQLGAVAPVVPSVVVTDALSATVSWNPVAGAASYDYTINGGSVLNTVGTSFTIAAPSIGVTPVQVRSVPAGSGDTSTWATATVTNNYVVPGVPAVSAPTTVGVPSVTATWPAAAYALSYEYRVNGGSSSATTATSVTIPSLAPGANSVSVRSLDNLAQSAWATVTVTYTVPAPAVSVPATVWATTATVSWAAVTGATSYEYAVNGGSTASTSATSVVADGLALGTNAITVRTVQGANRSTWTSATIFYSTPSPVTLTLWPSSATVQSPATSTTLLGLISAPAETFRLQSSPDGSAWSDTGLSQTSTATPAPQAFTVPVSASAYYRLVFDGNARWAAATSNVATITYDATVRPPTLESFAVTDTLSAVVSWPAIEGAASYDYTLNGGSTQSTLGASFLATGLSPGANTVAVRTVDAGHNTSTWTTVTLTVEVVVPAAPVVSVPATVWASSIDVSWAPVDSALSYEYRLDGGTATPTAATGATVSLGSTGPHVVEVRALNNLAQGEWTTCTITYELPSTPTLTLVRSATRVTFPATSVTLTGLTSAPSAHVRLESSTNGATWVDSGVSWTSAATPAPVAMQAGISRTTYYRLVLDAGGPWTQAVSPVVSVGYAPRLTTPRAPSRVKRRAKFTVSETLTAPAANSASMVTFQFFRYQKVRGRYKWVLRKSVRVRGAASGYTTTYKARTYLPYTGKWRVVAAYNGGTVYVNVTSAARAMRVR